MYHFNMEKSREIATTKTPVSLPYYTDRMLRCMFDIFLWTYMRVKSRPPRVLIFRCFFTASSNVVSSLNQCKRKEGFLFDVFDQALRTSSSLVVVRLSCCSFEVFPLFNANALIVIETLYLVQKQLVKQNIKENFTSYIDDTYIINK